MKPKKRGRKKIISKTANSAIERLRLSLAKAKAAKKELTAKLKAKTNELKKKLKQVETRAITTLYAKLEREMLKKEEARKKALLAAELQFEKAYEKKRAKRMTKPSYQQVEAATYSTKPKGKPRGRKSTKTLKLMEATPELDTLAEENHPMSE